MCIRDSLQGDGYVAVPETLAHHLDVDAGAQELRRVRVAQIVEAALDLSTSRPPPRRPRSRGVCWAFASRCQTAPDSLRKDEA